MLKKVQALFEKVIARIEGNTTPFKRYFYLFIAILVLRLALEFFSSKRLFRLDDILHISLWFIFIVQAFLVQLQFFSGEKMMRVGRIVIVCFSIALTAPILDLIITNGVGAKMNYLSLRSWDDIWWSYITIGGSSFSRGATPGIRLEIILLLIASFNYVRTKRKSILWAIASTFCIYTVLFISGAIPLILGSLVDFFHLQYEHNDQSTVLLLLTLDTFLFLLILYRYAPKHVRQVLSAAPWGAIPLSLIMAVIGSVLAIHNYPGNFSVTPTTLFWFPLLLALVFCLIAYSGIRVINNQGGENKGLYSNGRNILALLLLLISCMISAQTFFTVTLLWGLGFLLYEPPLQLKQVPILRNLLEAMLLLSAALVGYCTFNAPMIGFPANWIGAILIGGFTGCLAIGIRMNGTSVVIKLVCIALLLVTFGIFYFLLMRNSDWGVVFLLSSILPVSLIWTKTLQLQLILLALTVPCSVVLLALIRG